MLVLKADNQKFVLDVLDYEEKASTYRPERNQLLVSIELKNEQKSSVVTGAWLATHELSALGNWFGQVASGVLLPPMEFLEPGLLIQATTGKNNTFHVKIQMHATAGPQWLANQLSSESFDMTFTLQYEQMLQAARQLQELHQRFPTQ